MFIWILITGSITAFLTSCTIGANDVANSFATSVGAKVLSLRQAVIIAGIFEFAGAVLMGSHVTDTLRKGIVSVDLFQDRPYVLMYGMLCANIATGLWLAAATYFKAPVSTTHSVVGSIIGFALAYAGTSVIIWSKVWLIVASWIISPLLSGFLTLVIFAIIKYGALRREDPINNSLKIFPLMVFLAMAINAFFITYKGTPALGLSDTPLWVGILSAVLIGLFSLVTTVLFNKYYLKQKLMDNLADIEKANGEDKKTIVSQKEVDKFQFEEYAPSAEKLFSYLQVFTACMSAFAHGANDVANSVGPYAAIVSIYLTSSAEAKSEVPIWILVIGGAGIVVGLALCGKRVIQRMGSELVYITPSRGFSMELGSSLSVVTASRLGIPVSTTHCQVGSIVGGGLADGKTNNVSWNTFLKVLFGWLITLPVTAGLSAMLFSFGFYSPN